MYLWAVSLQPCNDVGELRLSNEDEGIVKVCVNDEWALICGYDYWSEGTNWGPSEALVTCRQLGFNCKFF